MRNKQQKQKDIKDEKKNEKHQKRIRGEWFLGTRRKDNRACSFPTRPLSTACRYFHHPLKFFSPHRLSILWAQELCWGLLTIVFPVPSTDIVTRVRISKWMDEQRRKDRTGTESYGPKAGIMVPWELQWFPQKLETLDWADPGPWGTSSK